MNQDQVKAKTKAAADAALADVRRGRLESQMTGRIHKAWAQLDVATDEIVRLTTLIRVIEADRGETASFQHDLAMEKAKAMGKAEILALFMPPPLHTPQAVSVEAGQRYSARQRGVKHETPGVRLAAATVLDDVDGRPVTT